MCCSMVTTEWRDVSNWRDLGTDKPVIETWEAKYGEFTLRVFRRSDQLPVRWLASCQPPLFSDVQLASRNLEGAKCQAKAKLQSLCLDAIRDILAAEATFHVTMTVGDKRGSGV